jgi:hypothetical protein
LNNSVEELAAESESASGRPSSHALRRSLGLWDLVPMQILLVIGITWAGTAAKQGATHVAFWVAAILSLFIPQAAVVGWCAQAWPLEGGVYQWAKFALGPFAGFMCAWNFGMWALLAVSNVGIMTATSLTYALGPRAAWMEESHTLIAALTIGIFLAILGVNVPGLGIGRWVAHFGTAVTVTVTVLLMALLFIHPHAGATHPHVNPQAPFSLAMPALTLFSVNIFTKIAFGALTGLEQVAVFAGETRDAGRTIMRSAWVAAPVIAAIYMLMTGSVLAYIPAAKVDLTGPVPQVLAAAFAGGDGSGAINWGLMLGRAGNSGIGVGHDCRLYRNRRGDQPSADGGRVGQNDSCVVYATRSALEDADAIAGRYCGAGHRDGPSRNVWHRRAGGLPTAQFGEQHFLWRLLSDDVRRPAGGGQPVWRACRFLAQGRVGERAGGDAAGDGIQPAAHCRCH